MRDWQHFFTEEDAHDYVMTSPIRNEFELIKYLNAKIREALQAAPKVYGNSNGAYGWAAFRAQSDNMSGRLVDVKPIEKGE